MIPVSVAPHDRYALDTVLPDLKSPTKVKVVAAMQGHVIAHAELMGTYQRWAPRLNPTGRKVRCSSD